MKVPMRRQMRGIWTRKPAVLKHQSAAVEETPAATEAKTTVTVTAEPAGPNPP